MSDIMNETVSDIMSEMREYADSMEKHLLYDLRECATDYLRILADRIEAAAKREREAGAEAAQICGEIVEIIGREATCEKSSQVGNAAAKHQFREVTKMIPHEEMTVAEMQQPIQPVTDCHELNAAAMRWRRCGFICLTFLQYMRLHHEDAEGGGYYERILDVVNSALSASPRNCDVGTAEEQAKRFKSFCKTHLSGIRSICSTQCPCVGCRRMFHCLTKWEQMPYEEGGAK